MTTASSLTGRLDAIERWGPSDPGVDPWLVLRLARYRRREAVSAQIWRAAETAAGRARALVAPRAWVRVLEVTAEDGGVRLGEDTRVSGSAVARLLLDAPRAAAFVLTLGPALEAETLALAERDEPLEAYLLDLAGWAALETAIRGLRRALGTALAPARVGPRLGPGHADWPIEEQPRVLGLLGPAAEVVSLSETGLMMPMKTVSGVFAVRDESPEPSDEGPDAA